jgi:excisionase family DNA binding protein
MEINEREIYTTSDIQRILKISQSTAMRLLKKGHIRSTKVGKQYRVLGKELLRLVSPEPQEGTKNIYERTTS